VIRVALAALVAAAAAGAAPAPLAQLPRAAGCVAPRVPGCTVGGIGTAVTAAVAPDGRTVYAAGGVGSLGQMAILRREPRAGALTTLPGRRGCVHVYRGSVRCEPVRALETPSSIAVPNDVRHVYVAAASNRAVTTFARRGDGSLVQPPGQAACVAFRVSRCREARALTHPVSLALAPDGRTLYAVGNSAIVVLRRTPATGLLVQPEGEDGCVAVGGAFGCRRVEAGARIFRGALAVSPDGRHLYAATGGSLYVFARDPATGVLEDVACLDAAGAAGCTQVEGLGRPDALAVSNDGSRVYTAAGGRALLVLDRGEAGTLTPSGTVALPFRALTLAPSRRGILVGGDRGVAVVAGTTLRGATTRIRGPRGPFGVAASPDGRNVYAVGRGGVAVLALR
jgi:DNA-binding beta-propeller fold protein YncE